jgi:hypothetical protein
MRRLIVVTLAAAALAASPACHRKSAQQPKAEATEEEAPGLASIVQMAEPATAAQLVRGFHSLEQNSWRWTEGRFAVTLRPPHGAAQTGAMLKLNFALPDAVLNKVRRTALSAKVNGVALTPETYDRPGEHVYAREVPASALAGDAVPVEFALDKYLPPGAIDQRELGLVVTQVGLETK